MSWLETSLIVFIKADQQRIFGCSIFWLFTELRQMEMSWFGWSVPFHVQGWTIPHLSAAPPHNPMVIFTNLPKCGYPNSFKPNSYMNDASESPVCGKNTEGLRETELQQERDEDWAARVSWHHALCHKLAFLNFSGEKKRMSWLLFNWCPTSVVYNLVKNLAQQTTRFLKCFLQLSLS